MMFGTSGYTPRPDGSARHPQDPSHEDLLEPTESGMFLYAQQQEQQQQQQQQEQQQGRQQPEHQQARDQQLQQQQQQQQRQMQPASPRVEPSSPFGAPAQQGASFAGQNQSPPGRSAGGQSRLGPQVRCGAMWGGCCPDAGLCTPLGDVLHAAEGIGAEQKVHGAAACACFAAMG